MNKRVRRLPTIYLYPDEDADLIAWLDSLGRGVNKSRLVKEVLRRGLQSGTGPSNAAASISLEADVVREAIGTAIAEHLDLTQIRRVVEAAVVTALAAARVTMAQAQDEDDDEMNDMLDGLGGKIML